MKCLFLDCFSGISGDMTLGALVDLGLPQKHLKEELAKLRLPGYSLHFSRTTRMGISGRRLTVKTTAGKQPHRSYSNIEAIITKSRLAPSVKESSLTIFKHIARAEAEVHNKKIEDIHFHEVGALDSIVDIVGCAVGIDYLGIEKLFASEVPLGHGFVTCRHGTIPVPAPATLKILKGVPVYSAGVEAEMVTPTGAAILAGLVDVFGPMPPMTIGKTGYGSGTRELKDRPNMLRVIMGTLQSGTRKESVRVLEANIDDMNPEWAGYLMERLFEEGALDVSFIPAQMKKNRPGILVKIVCNENQQNLLTAILFQESTTAGVRSYRAERSIVTRRSTTIRTRYGSIKAKVLGDGSGGERIVPEFEECRRLAQSKKLPLRKIYEEVIKKR